MRLNLLRDEIEGDDRNQRVPEYYLLDGRGLSWYVPLDGIPVLVVHQTLAPALISLVLTLRAHPGVASTLVSIRGHGPWPCKARDDREYVFLCGCKHRSVLVSTP